MIWQCQDVVANLPCHLSAGFPLIFEGRRKKIADPWVHCSYFPRRPSSDDIAIERVQFFLGGKSIVVVLTSPSYTVVWDSTTDGSYKLYVVAQDTSGNFENSWVNVTVKNDNKGKNSLLGILPGWYEVGDGGRNTDRAALF